MASAQRMSRVVYLLSVAATICSLVSLNALSPFLVASLAPSKNVASIVGTLVFADQLLAIGLVLIWGWISDRSSARLLVIGGHGILALALAIFPTCKRAYPDLLLARLLFSIGASALTTAIPAVLAALTPSSRTATAADGGETEPLLARTATTKLEQPAFLAGMVGLSSGLGALVGVFGVLRLPNALSSDHSSITEGLTSTFYILVVAEGVVAMLAAYFLVLPDRHARSPKPLRGELRRLVHGIQLARTDMTVALACASSFASRASAIAVSQLIPTFVAAWYLRTDRCHLGPDDTLKLGCRPAFALASSLTGTIQLVALLAAPFVGFIGARRPATIPRYLLHSAIAGIVGFVAFSLLPDGDPRKLGVAVPASILIGLSEITSTVLGLSLCGTARQQLIDRAGNDDDAADEVGGAIAGVFSLSGAVGILMVAKIGGSLTESSWHGAPFAFVSVTDVVLGAVALVVVVRVWRGRSAE